MQKDTRTKRVFNKLERTITTNTPPHIKCIIVFGSYARGMPREESDIDVYIITEKVKERKYNPSPETLEIEWNEELPEPHIIAIHPEQYTRRYYTDGLDDGGFLETVEEEGVEIYGSRKKVRKNSDISPFDL